MKPPDLMFDAEMQEFFREFMGKWQPFDKARWVNPETELIYRNKWVADTGKLWFYTHIDTTIEVSENDPALYRIPEVFSRDLKRCLWHMVDWTKMELGTHDDSGDVYLFLPSEIEEGPLEYEVTLEEALLGAIKWQIDHGVRPKG
jgi:hypothetical protein